METWKPGNLETWRHGDTETWRRRQYKHGDVAMRHGNMVKWRHGVIDGDMAMEM
jgi:hypothetical protein